MGAVTFSIDQKLITTLKGSIPFHTFIETGTFRGETIDIVKNFFENVYSIELSPLYYAEALQKYQNNQNISLIHDDSACALANLSLSLQNKPIVYWLDAHWCVADNTAGQNSQCPLLSELKAIKHLNLESIIIIDDARLFLATPPIPHEVSQWPTLHTIIAALSKLSTDHHIGVINDCILFFPPSSEPAINDYARNHGIDWLHILNKSKYSDEILLPQLLEKEDQIHKMASSLLEKEDQIQNMASSLLEKENLIHKMAATIIEKNQELQLLKIERKKNFFHRIKNYLNLNINN